MSWIVIALFLGYVFVGTWAVFDAYERTDQGCLWLMLFILFPGISVIAYVIIRFYAYRPQKPVPELAPRDYGGIASRFGSEIEKARFLEAAARGPGTMYDPGRTAGAGFRHFTDERAEALLAEARFDEAFAYLSELLDLARGGGDPRAEDTYLYYIHRLPDGAQLLAKWEQERGGSAGDAPDRTGPRRPPPRREVPF